MAYAFTRIVRLGFPFPKGPTTIDAAGIHLGHVRYGFLPPSRITISSGQEVKWCACGKSEKQPFCDGTHSKIGSRFTPIPFKAKETKEYIFCNCKQSKNKPFCDNTHANLKKSR